jgi:hypothetical protein
VPRQRRAVALACAAALLAGAGGCGGSDSSADKPTAGLDGTPATQALGKRIDAQDAQAAKAKAHPSDPEPFAQLAVADAG